MKSEIQKIIELHRQFWSGEIMAHPLAAFRIAPDFFFSTHINASRTLLVPGQEITPKMIDVDAFLDDYKRAAQEIEQIGQDAFWVAEPFVGFPWMEAICGCSVFATENSFISHPCLSSVQEHNKVAVNDENLWLEKYMEFTTKLIDLFKGKYSIGQPITRGITDVVGALIGQTEMVFAIYDYPDETKLLMSKVADVFLKVIKKQQDLISSVYGGYSMGFYHLWSPGKCMWFQEDLTSLISPAQYREFVKKLHIEICSHFDYTAIHMHSSSFHLLDEILDIDRLKVIEINKDIGGLTIEQMIPVFKKVQDKGKKLIIWGDINQTDIDMIKDNLQMKGLHFNIIAPDVSVAKELSQYIRKQ
ncbi:MAG: hypothetical protein AB7G87_11125 [Clostridia bacterium]